MKNDEATEVVLREAGLPVDLKLMCFGKGSVRHVVDRSRTRGSRFIWCNMYTPDAPSAREPGPGDSDKPVCGGCVRSTRGVTARINERNRIYDANQELLRAR